jgi:predicted metalloprotease
VVSFLAVACSADPGVVTHAARESQTASAPTEAPNSTPPSTDAPASNPSTSPSSPSSSIPDTDPSTSSPPSPSSSIPDTDPADLIDEGNDKPERDYDDFLARALADVQAWWSEQFPVLYGEPFEPLRGGVYAAYPERTDPIPGCGGRSETTYEEISEFAAFYCPNGDFMVYDDGEEGILFRLADELGPTSIGVVMAHEYGHAIQARAGEIRRNVPTILTEQQADCFAGAWVARAVNGQSELIELTDDDVRVGLLAMITVRDPLGIDQFSQGGHGSAFDRVGAFQFGFTEGVERCAQLIDEPLPLVPNLFQPDDDDPDGNADFGYGAQEIVGLITNDLNEFWPDALAASDAQVPVLEVVPVESADDVDCENPAGDFATGAVLCAVTDEVFFNEPFARDLYDRYGDFVVGFILGGAWGEAAQQALGSPLVGEDRALLSDCLTGAWASTLIPDEDGDLDRAARIQPGDLDEAIRSALVIGDRSSTDDVRGSGFEKIASFREGVLDGIDVCTARLPD